MIQAIEYIIDNTKPREQKSIRNVEAFKRVPCMVKGDS